MRKILLIIPMLMIYGISNGASSMSQELLEETVKKFSKKSEGEKGIVKFTYNKVEMYLISDVKHDRMRIIAPIVKFKKLTRKHIDAALESNFHKALDARYAVSKGVLYSAYIHPLAALSKSEIKSAMLQVSNLAVSFGNEYSSGLLSFGRDKKVKEKIIEDGVI